MPTFRARRCCAATCSTRADRRSISRTSSPVCTTTTAKCCGLRTAMWSERCCRRHRCLLLSRFRRTWRPRCRTSMLWLTNTVWAGTRMRRALLNCGFACLAVCLTSVCLTSAGWGQNITVPTSAVAGEPATLSIAGSGKATFYLIGPGVSNKHEINLGEDIKLRGDVLRNAGDYQVIVCSDSCHSTTFFVIAAKPASLSFLVHPSRVPVSLSDAVSGVAFPFDRFHNLVLTPVTINFHLSAGNESLL